MLAQFFFNHQVSESAGSTTVLISQTVNHTGAAATGCAESKSVLSWSPSRTNRWISRAHLESQAAPSGPLSPPRIDYSSWLILGQLIPANSVLSVPYLLLSLTNLTFMVHWLASVRSAACKFTLKSFVLTAFSRAPGRGRTGSRQARPPALITVGKSGFEPLGWSLGPAQGGLTWRKVNLCHTCVTIWIMEFCNLSERGGKRSPEKKKKKRCWSLASPAFMLSTYTRVPVSCVNTQGMSELMKSWSMDGSETEGKQKRGRLRFYIQLPSEHLHTTHVSQPSLEKRGPPYCRS